MATAVTLKRYWPWWVPLGWMIGYESIALATHHPTLSRLVWRATRKTPVLPFIVIVVDGVLVYHFWVGLGKPADVV